MSQSYPSSSWEPYGSSQQQHALGWRRTATRPAHASPPSQFPALARWNQFHAPSLTDPLPFPKPLSNPRDQFTVSAALQQHERDSRSLERYNTVRTDISVLEAKLQKILETVEELRKSEGERHETIASEFAKVQTGCIRLRDEIRGEIVGIEARLIDSVQRVLSTTVESAVRRVVGASFSEWKQLVKNAISEPTLVQTHSHGLGANGSGRQTETRQHAARVTHKPRHRHNAPVGAKVEPRALVQTHVSDEEYALRVAYKKRKKSDTQSSNSSPDSDGLLDQWMMSQDENRPRSRRAAKRPKKNAEVNFYENRDESSNSVPVDQDDTRDQRYTPSRSCSSTSSSSWLPHCRRGKRKGRGGKRNSEARKNGSGGGRNVKKRPSRRSLTHAQEGNGRKRKYNAR